MFMEDCASGDEDQNHSDQESLDGFENEDFQLVTTKGPTTQVITRESLLAAQREDLRRVMEMLSVREHHARTLLIYHRWDVELLFQVYVDKGKTILFAEAGVSMDEHDQSVSLLPSKIMCEICMEDVPCDEATKMDCGHCFCNNCWTEHFIVKINEGQSKRIRCMALRCNTICDEAVVRTLVSKKQLDMAEKFERFLLESYIEDNKRVKWCPSIPHCGNAIRVDEDELCEVECSCGLQFCFNCLSEAHSPCSCLMWELWAKKCQDESETVNWITVNTKACPKCHKPVEKNGGCNLVSCFCGQAFCWLCGGATGREHTWSSIAGHSCGRYKEQEKKTERAKQDLYRYMHYHNRYKAHTDSFKLESILKETIQEKVAISEEKDSKLRDYSWVNNGLSRLFRSRRVLSYSYPFAYYMFGDELFKDEMSEQQREIKQNLFEDQQQQLEENVEKLSKYLEEPFDEFSDDKVVEIRMQVINLSNITDSLCQKMYDCIENDLLDSLQLGTHRIAPYKSKGIERALELSPCWSNKSNNIVGSVGGTAELDLPSGSGSSEESECPSHKHPRKDDGLGAGTVGGTAEPDWPFGFFGRTAGFGWPFGFGSSEKSERPSHKHPRKDDGLGAGSVGGTAELDRPSGSCSLEESECPSRKHPGKDDGLGAGSVGGTAELDRPSGSGSSEESACPSHKRPRKDDGLGGGGLFDLNLPAEV